MGKFLLRSHFLSICDNMRVKWYINHGGIHCLSLYHTFWILLYHLSCVIPVLICATEWEKRRFFLYIAASSYHVISKEIENRVFKHNRIFRHNRIFINNPYLQISGVITILCKYYILISDTLKGSCVCFSFYWL